MRHAFLAILALGLGLAGYAVYMAQGYVGAYQDALEQERARAAEAVPLTDIYVATRQLRFGERLTGEDVRLVRWPAESLPEGVFPDEAALFPEGTGTPRTVLRAIEENEPILAVKVTAPGEDAGVSSRLPKGMRAFAIRVDVASGVSGFLRPEDRVDVYWSGRTGGGDALEAEVTKLIERNIRLLAVDQTADKDRSGPVVARTVTVAATPRQVAALAQAQATGRLSLALVGAADDTEVAAVEIDQRELLGIEKSAPAAPPEEQCTIRTRRGAETHVVQIPCPD